MLFGKSSKGTNDIGMCVLCRSGITTVPVVPVVEMERIVLDYRLSSFEKKSCWRIMYHA